MSGWDDLVTTSLLGTERRALPGSLPPAVGRLAVARGDAGHAVLDAAAGYVSYLTAGARPAGCPVPEAAPRQAVDLAPEPAQALLRRLLDAGDVTLVDMWLAECGDRGLGVRSDSWTALATAAAGSSGPDRSLVRAALGQRGLAFLRLNPAWRSVLRPSRDVVGTPLETVELAGQVTPALVAVVPRDELDALALSWVDGGHDPARVARWLALLPGPWGTGVTDAGLQLLTSGRLDARAGRCLGLVLGHRAALSAHEQIRGITSSWPTRPTDGTRAFAAPAPGLLEAADVLALRVEIRRAFGPTAPNEETS